MKLFELFVDITLDKNNFDRGVGEAAQQGKDLAGNLQKSVSAFTVAAGHLMSTAISKGIGLLKSFAQTGITFNSQLETYTTNFTTMLGSAEAAVAKVNDLKQMAAKTPFGMSDLAKATQTMLAFQVPANKTNKILNQLGDIALGDKNKLTGLSLVFGQVSSAGKLTGQDLMQFINQGFNPLNYIAERTGETMEELRDRMSKGAVTVAEVEQAFEDATSEGGQFYRGMESGSKTLEGQWSTLKDTASELAGAIMAPFARLAQSEWLPAIQTQMGNISAAIDKVFGTSKNATDSLSEDSLPPVTQKTKDWLDGLLAAWSDGEKESDDIVKSFVDGFTGNTAELKDAINKRIEDMSAAGEDTTALEEQVKLLDDYDAKITDLLAQRQNGMFTADDQQMLDDITAAKSALEDSLADTTQASDGADTTAGKMDLLTTAINGVGAAITTVIENWEAFKTIAAGAISLVVGFKMATGVSKIAAAFGIGMSGGPVAAVALTGAALLTILFNWPSDEELAQYMSETDTKLSKWAYFVTVSLGMPSDQEIFAWVGQMWDKITSAVSSGWGKITTWAAGIWNALIDAIDVAGILNGLKIDMPANTETERSGGGGSASQEAGAGRSASELAGAMDNTTSSAESLDAAADDAAGSLSSVDGASSSAGYALKVLSARLNAFRLPTLNAAPNVYGPIPHADGGIFSRPTLLGQHLVAEAGAEAILPLSNLWAEMSERMDRATRNSIDYDRLALAIESRPTNIVVDGYVMASTMADANQRALDERDLRYVRGKGGR